MTKSKFNTKQLVLAALCVALGVVLPVAFHSIPNAGSVLLPMHCLLYTSPSPRDRG